MSDIKEFLGEQENDIIEPTECDAKKGIDALIEDENEAISGYQRIIQLYKISNLSSKDEAIKVLQDIEKEEYEHIEKLKALSDFKVECEKESDKNEEKDFNEPVEDKRKEKDFN